MPTLHEQMNILLDLAHVDFIDSTGIGLLIKFSQHIFSLESKLTITNIRFDVLEVLKLLQVPEILDFVEFPQIAL